MSSKNEEEKEGVFILDEKCSSIELTNTLKYEILVIKNHTIKFISSGSNHFAAITETGLLWTWLGFNYFFQDKKGVINFNKKK